MEDGFPHEFFYAKKEIKTLAIMFLGIFVFGTIGYALIDKVTPWQGFIHTIETLTFSTSREYGIARVLQTMLHLFGAIIIWFTLWTSFDLMIEGQFTKYFSGVKIMDNIKRMKDHYIICGGGRVGEHTAELLKKKKKKFVLIEKDSSLTEDMIRKGYLILKGDAINEETLLEAGIKKARAVIAVLHETEKNILVTLTAKELNPKAKIYSRSDKREYVKKLRKAGADFVSMPEYSCAEEIAGKIR